MSKCYQLNINVNNVNNVNEIMYDKYKELADLGERTVYDEFCGGPSKNVESFLPILKKYYEFDFVYSSSVSWYERDSSSRIVKNYS